MVVSAIKNVSKVIKQNTHDYSPNLRKLKPNYVLHGDDWKYGVQKNVRAKVIKELKNGMENYRSSLHQRNIIH